MRPVLLLTVMVAIGPLASLSSPALAAPDPAKGQVIFQDRCAFCHPADGVGQGPNLKGVVGRKAGSAPDFTYTDALKTSGLTWTPENLSKFLIGPRDFVPGTAMQMVVPDETERADLIAYLASQK